MEMQQLHYFASVYKSRSITHSAEECHISTQGISVSIHRLEDELGEKLFERTSKGLVPTMYADFLFVRAQRILSSRDECIDFFNKNKRPEDICKISLAQGTIEEYAGPIIKEYRDSFPHVHLEIQEGPDKKCIDDVLLGNAELAVVGGPLDKELFDIVELFTVGYALITPTSSPWAQLESILISDLRSIPISILSSENSTNSMLMNFCSQEGFEPEIFCVPHYVLSLFSLVENGLSSGVVTESLARRMAKPEITIVPIRNQNYFWKLSLIKTKNAVLSKAASNMWNFMEKAKNRGA